MASELNHPPPSPALPAEGREKEQSPKADTEWLSENWNGRDKSADIVLGATVTALRGRVFAATEARPRKAVTVAP